MLNKYILLFFLCFGLNNYSLEIKSGEERSEVGVIKKIDLKNKVYFIKTNDKKNHRVAQDDLVIKVSPDKLNAGDAVIFIKHKEAINR